MFIAAVLAWSLFFSLTMLAWRGRLFLSINLPLSSSRPTNKLTVEVSNAFHKRKGSSLSSPAPIGGGRGSTRGGARERGTRASMFSSLV